MQILFDFTGDFNIRLRAPKQMPRILRCSILRIAFTISLIFFGQGLMMPLSRVISQPIISAPAADSTPPPSGVVRKPHKQGGHRQRQKSATKAKHGGGRKPARRASELTCERSGGQPLVSGGNRFRAPKQRARR